MKRFAALLLLFAALLWSVQSFASTYPNATGAAGVRVWNEAISGPSSTFNSGSVPTALREVSPVTNNLGGVLVGASGLLLVAGQNLPVNYQATVTASVLLGAVGGFFQGGVPGALIGGGMPLLMAWFQAAGGHIDPSTGAVSQEDPSLCTTAPCYDWSGSVGGVPVSTSSASATCTAIVAASNAAHPGEDFTETGVTTSGSSGTCSYSLVLSGYKESGSSPMSEVSVAPSAPSYLPSSMADIEPYMANTPFDPGVVDELANQGVSIPVTGETLTGPASVPGPITTTTNPDGSTSTSQKTTPYTYAGPDVTAGPTTDTTTATPPTGAASGTTSTTTTTTTQPNPDQDQTPVGTPMPGIPNLYTQKYPGGLSGVWSTDSTALQSTPLMSLPGQLMPSIPSGGACPDFPISLDFAPWANFGNQDFAPPCSVWTFCQAIIMITALFVARGIVFGG